VIEELLTFVVVGAGPTGVEMAGQISELAHRTLPKEFRNIDTRKARIILLDAMPTVLGTFGTKLSASAAKQLKRLGIELWLDSKVVDVDNAACPSADAQRRRGPHQLPHGVWAAGVRASSLGRKLAEQAGAEVDRSGRILVEPDCTLPGYPDVFILGDMMALNNYPGVAQVAMQSGKYAADQIVRRVKGRAPKGPFKYFDKGSMATISRFNAVASVGPLRFSGFIAWVSWLAIHVRVPGRLQEPAHDAAALGGELHRQRPLAADRDAPATDRAAEMAASSACACSGRQMSRSGRYGWSRLYTSGEPSMRDACRPAATTTPTGAAESHSHCPPACR
jgi:NADH dehydrogenase FAD-containing subunit